MAVGPFLSHDSGWAAFCGGGFDFENDDIAAVLVTNSHTPDRAADIDYEDIAGDECEDGDYSPQALSSKSVSVVSNRVRIDCGKITFTAEGSISARYVYFVLGDASSLANGDLILGHVDLTGSDNASSVNGEFSFDPHSSGLVELTRTAAPA